MKEAKYTEYFSDYLETHELPEVFDEIEGLEDLFIGHYCDAEIGFETEDLFEIKLEKEANLWIPRYKEQIDLLAAATLHISSPTKTRYVSRSNTLNAGAQKGKTTDLPINATSATPNTITESDAYVNSDSGTEQATETGLTEAEMEQKIDWLNGQVFNLVAKCIEHFKPLFMEVY